MTAAGATARERLLQGLQCLDQPPAGIGSATTSELSIDETLLLHALGWEAVAVVTGTAFRSIYVGAWTWARGEISAASQAHMASVHSAAEALMHDCTTSGGQGVVGVRVEARVERHHAMVDLVGTAVRPMGRNRGSTKAPFASELSGRDFALLLSSGWEPVGIAFGASYANAPRRNITTTLRQTSQNVELVNWTNALYGAREAAMERMQTAATSQGGHGIVGVKMSEGPMTFASHAIGFAAMGTTVRLAADSHRSLDPQVMLRMNDAVVAFDAQNLRG